MPITIIGSGGVSCVSGIRAVVGVKMKGGSVPALSFVAQPQSKTVDEYALATFSCEVTGGVAPYSYQWKKDGVNVGANSAALSFTAASADKNASITVTVTDSTGSVITSTAALLSVMRNVVSFNGTTQVMDAPRVSGIDLDNLNCELEIRCDMGATGTMIAQNVSADSALRAFQISSNLGTISLILGGTLTAINTSGVTLELATWSFRLLAGSCALFKNGVLATTTITTIGAAREPSATLTVGARHSGSNSSYGFFLPSKVYHAKIWAGGDRNTGTLVRDYRMNDGFANNPVCVNSGTVGAAGNGTYIGLTSGSWSREVAS